VDESAIQFLDRPNLWTRSLVAGAKLMLNSLRVW
jgi:hypothetical protein